MDRVDVYQSGLDDDDSVDIFVDDENNIINLEENNESEK